MAAADSKPVIRLSTAIIPTLYDVALIPRLDSFTFAGQVYIDIRVNQPSSTIILHALDQTIDSVIINKIDAGKTVVEVSSFSLNEEKQTLTIESKSALEVGDYRLSIVFNGILNDKLAGFYRSSYVSQNGDKKFLAVTQFEAADARRALPCFDEPLFKAVWRVTLIVDKQYNALSNMPVKERTTLMATPTQVSASPSSYENISAYQSLVSRGLLKWDAEMVYYTYQDSPIMSSYLLAFCVGEFDYLSAFTVADATSPSVEVRIYTTPGKNQLGHFALDVAVRSLQFYNQWFGIPYPLPKVDLIAIPDFASGAMENWGLITYREQALLIDPEHSSALVKQRACRTICHELAHMWFGNLVTMEWWQYLWLNEGFARFTEHLAADHLFPQWQLWTQFGQDTYALAQGLDALESSHPIEVTVHSSDEANEIFDTISYAKGASVIRMLYDAIGHETFQAGIRLYLKKFSYKNTVSEDLWDSLTEATQNKVNIRQLMDHWVKHDGYPVLRLDDGVVNPNGRLCFHYHQQRFLVSGASDEKKESSHWSIPFTAAYFNTKGDNGKPETTKLILDKKDGEFEVEKKSDKIIKLNHQHTSFIRVQYSHAHFASLSSIVNTMPASDRLGLQRDAYALAASGRIPIADALDLIVHYSKENDYSVVAALSTSLQSLSVVHANESYFPLLQKFIGYLYRTNYHAVGWDAKPDDSHLTALLRQNVISMMSLADDIEVKQEALRRIRAYVVDEKNAIGADLRSIVYQTTAKALGKEGREILLSIYSKATMAEEKGRVLSAIGHIDGKSSDASELIQSAVDFVFGDSVRTGDIHFAMASLASSKIGQQFIWNYVKTNWSAMMERFAKMGFVLGYVLSATLSHFSTHADANDVEEFFAKNSCPVERTVKQSVEAIRSRANRLERERNQVEAWLKKHEANFV